MQDIEQYLLRLQQTICTQITLIDNSPFLSEQWVRPAGGGGKTNILENGNIIEKAGINFSHVTGEDLPASASASRPELASRQFNAMGVSLVIHPRNPYAPTVHANIRFFMATHSQKKPVWWFGGGFDLTPYYAFEEDCIHWHQTAKLACDPFGKEVYPRYKKWCDDYFFLKHRQEARGIGGLFFDDLNDQDLNAWEFEKCFAFMQSVGDHILKGYLPILLKRKDLPYTEKEKAFQNYRRGRYVEFNLIYDRGTLFGLQSQGRTESILMSLPPIAQWIYNWQPEKNSPEEKLTAYFLKPKDWLNIIL